MKFKTIFLLFNLFIVIAFLMISLVPLFVLGGEYARLFWSKNWIISSLFLLFIGALDGYFISNWKLFNLLEKEDWPMLITYLEEALYQKKKFNRKNISLLINTYLSVSNIDKMKRLETEIQAQAPRQMGYFALYLGTPYLLETNLTKCAEYFSRFVDLPAVRFPEWIQWCYAFSLVSLHKIEESRDRFLELLRHPKDEILSLLSLYLLRSMDQVLSEEDQELISRRIQELGEKYRAAGEWEKLYSREAGNNLLVLLLSSLIKSSYEWLKESATETNSHL